MLVTADQNPQVETLSVLGFPVHRSQDYVGWLLKRIEQRIGGHVVTINAEMCMQAEADAQLRHLIHQADLVIPDGAGIELYLRWLQRKRVKRYAGIEFASDLLHHMTSRHKVAFYGGAPQVVAMAAEFWRKKVPGLCLVAVQHGYLSDAEQTDFQEMLKRQQPDLVFVGLGVPRQEFWIGAHRHLCPQATWIGVGGSFDIWAGAKTRAPKWFCDNHLEWLYRLYQEPWRWKRMLALPKFVWRALAYKLGRR